MKRYVDEYLMNWKNNKQKKPLIIFGARQIGKTFSMINLGRTYANYVYCNFENEISLSKIFEQDLNPERIIKELSILKNVNILKEETLIIFDEIQACEKALTSLKYFNEQASEYNIISAGSLLGLAVNRGNFSYPVGKVETLNMFPLNFEEFLWAINQQELASEIRKSYNSFSALSESFHNKCLELYRHYCVVGGYPEAVNKFVNTNDLELVTNVQSNIAESYIADMAKYATPSETIRSIEVYKSIVSQLSKDNTKFQYKTMGSKSKRAKDYESSIEWLKSSGVVLNCVKVTEGHYPLNIFEEKKNFKLYYSDIGILTTRTGLTPNSVIYPVSLSDKIKGMLAENYVAQQLTANNFKLSYWESDNTAEVDFVLQMQEKIIPVEVKFATNTRSKSLGVFMKKYNSEYAIRISAKNFGFENNIKSVPLYAVHCILPK